MNDRRETDPSPPYCLAYRQSTVVFSAEPLNAEFHVTFSAAYSILAPKVIIDMMLANLSMPLVQLL